FTKLPARPAKFVEGTAAEVKDRLDGYFAGDAGAGKIGARREEPLSGILAPHIDFNRGGPCYTFAYRELAERCDADLYVILGVAHLSPPNPFVVTSKDYETPLGTVSTDREVVAALEKRLGKKIYDHEPVHRSEHSAEFQAVFLKHARPSAKFTVVPILCSAFEQWCGVSSPSTAAEVEDVLGALRASGDDRRGGGLRPRRPGVRRRRGDQPGADPVDDGRRHARPADHCGGQRRGLLELGGLRRQQAPRLRPLGHLCRPASPRRRRRQDPQIRLRPRSRRRDRLLRQRLLRPAQ